MLNLTLQLSKEEKSAYLDRLEHVNRNRELLPHLYGRKRYKFQHEYFHSRAKDTHIVAANQVGKSTIQIEKCVHWSTEKLLWPELWPSKPTQFWYLYPSLGLATREFETKWRKEILPKGKMEDDPYYGWEAKFVRGEIHHITFADMVVYTRSYTQRAEDQQGSTVYAIFTDEELPEELYSELSARRNGISVSGYYSQAYTATLGQDTWRRCMEPTPHETELFPEADKWRVSLYDCLKYYDGSDSLWTVEEIEKRKNQCKSHAEVLRRIYGRFVIDTDLKYEGFERKVNYIKDHKLPKDWNIYVGIDVGSGGKAHPAAITFVAINREFTKGRVFLTWRGDNVETTSTDILKKYIQLRGSMKPVNVYYDWQSKDFALVARGANIFVQPAEKSQAIGEDLLNTLFKNEMLMIYEDENKPDNFKLVIELENLKNTTKKSNAKDDLIDSTRFAVTKVPWDFSHVNSPHKVKEHDPFKYMSEREKIRKGIPLDNVDNHGFDLVEAEVDMINEEYDYGSFENEPNFFD